MKRGNLVLENVPKLNTFVLMAKSNELLINYVNKISNKKVNSMKFESDFDCVSLDLLYTSLKVMNNNDKLTTKEFNKLDKDELKYYIKRLKGMKTITSQVPTIKKEEQLISYIKNALLTGSYVVNTNNTVRFDNGLVVDSLWLVDFANFIVNSLYLNANLSDDSREYILRVIELPKDNNIKDCKKYIKSIKLYEYSVKKDNKGLISYKDVMYLKNILSDIKKYDFRKLKTINSLLSKEGYNLSINKLNVVLDKNDRSKVEKLFNEEYYDALNDYLKNIYVCNDSSSRKNKSRLLDTLEYLRSIAHAYMANYSLDECRRLFDADINKDELLGVFAIANFYIYYVYDEKFLDSYFDYEKLDLDKLKPSIIDYETKEYKDIISKLSDYNKKMVSLNSKINDCLSNDLKTKREMYENSKVLGDACRELESVVANIKEYRELLNYEKNTNLSLANINRSKIRYIKESVMDGMYYFDRCKKLLVFDSYSETNIQKDFHLEIKLVDFINVLLSDHNKNLRIDFY
ncbi:MAG: hypothetical protein IKQ29_02455 [Bacilli bacterium]|nr:hypothetical protein [Bacilli bacterium]